MIYIVLLIALIGILITLRIVLSNHEVKRTRQEHRKHLRQRARRCIGSE